MMGKIGESKKSKVFLIIISILLICGLFSGIYFFIIKPKLDYISFEQQSALNSFSNDISNLAFNRADSKPSSEIESEILDFISKNQGANKNLASSAKVLLVTLYEENGDYEKAIDLLTADLDVNQDKLATYTNLSLLANIYQNTKDSEKEKKTIQTILNLGQIDLKYENWDIIKTELEQRLSELERGE